MAVMVVTPLEVIIIILVMVDLSVLLAVLECG
jgi:hypothetical protein